jgi:hypothetical protein
MHGRSRNKPDRTSLENIDADVGTNNVFSCNGTIAGLADEWAVAQDRERSTDLYEICRVPADANVRGMQCRRRVEIKKTQKCTECGNSEFMRP